MIDQSDAGTGSRTEHPSSRYRHPVGPLCIGDPGGDYNGFTWAERAATTPMQKLAVAEGRVRKPAVCGITGYAAGDDPRGRGYVFMHNEDYGRPLEFYAVGRFAHHALHSRFTDPLRWFRLVRRHYVHGAWFTLLTMDPADMKRPFTEVYPKGLPPHGTLWSDVADDLGVSPQVFVTSVAEAPDRGLHAGNPFSDGYCVRSLAVAAHRS